MKNSTKITLVVALLGTLGAGSLVKALNATQAETSVPAISQDHKTAQVAEAVGGDGDGETNDELEEQKESASWQSLAKITPQQAQQAAEKALGGQATRVQLENEDGDLVYSVIIGQNDVKVDAGNGTVLYTDSPQAEINESKRPHSSIHISEDGGGDGDGEVNDDG